MFLNLTPGSVLFIAAVPALWLLLRHVSTTSRHFSAELDDVKLEDRYLAEMQGPAVANLRSVFPVLAMFSLVWLILPSKSPNLVWLFYRCNNIVSALHVAAAYFYFDRCSRAACRRYYDITMSIWMIHHVSYNSLTSMRVAYMFGVPAAMPAVSDEGYQLLFSLIGICGVTTWTRVHTSNIRAAAFFGAYWWLVQGIVLGTYMDTFSFLKHGAAYSILVALIVRHSKHLEVERVGHLRRTAELEEQGQRQLEWLEGFQRTLALNFDVVTTSLELNAKGCLVSVDHDPELHAFCGRDLDGKPLATCLATSDERARFTRFGRQLHAQVEREPAVAHPAKLSVAFSASVDGSHCCRDVEVQVMWIPGATARTGAGHSRSLRVAQTKSTGGTRPLGFLWVGLRTVEGRLGAGVARDIKSMPQPIDAQSGTEEEEADVEILADADEGSQPDEKEEEQVDDALSALSKSVEALVEDGEDKAVSEAPSTVVTKKTDRIFKVPRRSSSSDPHGPVTEEWLCTLRAIAGVGRREHWLIDFQDVHLFPDCIIGAGSFGVVVAARMCGTGVAVKVSRRKQRGNPQFVHMLVNELRVLRRVRHPNVVMLIGACVDFDTGDLALVFEWLRGVKLCDYIGPPGQAPETFRRHAILLDVCCALQYLHSLVPPVVHGDLKASNVLVEESGGPAGPTRARLIDFGLSRLLGATRSPALGGTLGWMAPEVARNPSVAPAPCSDVFSFGRLMHFVLAGRVQSNRTGDDVEDHWPVGAAMCGDCPLLCAECLGLEPSGRPNMAAVRDRVAAWAERLDALETQRCRVRKTFLEMGDTTDLLDRIRSVEPWHHGRVGVMFCGAPDAPSSTASVASIARSMTAAVQAPQPPPDPGESSAWTEEACGSSSSGESSAGCSDGSVTLAPQTALSSSRLVSVREFMQVPRCPETQRSFSLGSAGHWTGEGALCKTCFWVQRGRACKDGWRCPYCHIMDGHDKYKRRKKPVPRGRRQAFRSPSRDPGSLEARGLAGPHGEDVRRGDG